MQVCFLLKRDSGITGEITKVPRRGPAIKQIFWRKESSGVPCESGRAMSSPSVSKPDADGAGGADDLSIRVHRLEMADGMGHIHGDDRAAL